jgi:magnesium transporter
MFRKRHPKVGARPGTLVIPEDAPSPKIHVVSFNADGIREEDLEDSEKLSQAFDESTVTWIDVRGFGDEAAIRKIGEIFSLHPLAIEDVVNAPQRPKAETYDDQLLLIVRAVRSLGDGATDLQQVSIILGKNYVLTFQERYGDVLDPVLRRIRAGKGPILRRGSDYLAYVVFDTVVDGYYLVLESVGDALEQFEEVVISNPSPSLLRRLNQTKNQLVNLRRSIWPQREAVNSLIRDDNPLITDEVRVYLRDTYDHCVQTTEVVEMYREMVTGLMNTYLSSIANRTNDVMKVLTIMASIFIPLTFMAGIYGMNFENMPELHVRWAYPVLWCAMICTAAGMTVYFWRKGWIGGGKDEDNPFENSD